MTEARSPAATEPFDRLVADFLDHLQFERGLARNTLDAYRNDMNQFGTYAAERGFEPPTASFEDLRSFVDTMIAAGASPATVQRRTACLRTFYRHLRLEEIIDHDPTADLRAPKLPQKLPQVLSRGEVERLIASVSGDGPADLRDRAMLEILYSSGLRASELADLNIGDVDLEAGFVRVTGKGGKQRIVPVGGAALKAVFRYLGNGRPSLARNGQCRSLFITQRGTKVTRQVVYKTVTRCAAQAGLEGRATTHTLRHTFATHMLAGGCDLRMVQEMLGHVDVSTTQIYTHLSAERLRDVFYEAHPRAA